MFKNRFIKNTSWIVFGSIIQAAFSFVMSILIARYLQPSNYGLINYTASIVAIFSSICTLGLNNTMIKFIIDNPDKEGGYLGTAVLMRLYAAIISTILLNIFLGIIYGFKNIIVIISLLQMFSVVLQSICIISSWFQSKLNSKVTVIVSFIGYVAASLFKLYCLAYQKDLIYFAFASVVEYFVVCLILFMQYKMYNGPKFYFCKDYAIEMFNKSYHFIFSNVMSIIYNQQDKIMLTVLMGEFYTGIYTCALNLCNSWTFILGAIIASATPIIYELNRDNKPLMNIRFKQLNCIIITISICAALFLTVFSNRIVIILYGNNYEQAIIPLVILSWHEIFKYLGITRSIWATCENLQKYEKWISIIGFSCNIVLNFILIKEYNVIGAAIATLLTQIVTNLIVPLFIKDLRPFVKIIVNSLSFKNIIDILKLKSVN